MSILLKQILFMPVFMHGTFATKQLLAIFDRVELCDKPPVSQGRWENFTFAMENGTSVLDSDLEYTGNPISEIKIRVNCKRCASREALDTCEDYHTLVASNGCAFLAMDNLMWSPFIKAFSPPLKCPFVKGKYRQTKGYFIAKSFSMFPIEDLYWKLKITISEKRRYLLTLCMEGYAKRKHV